MPQDRDATSPPTAENPHFSRAFAQVYEKTATRIMGPISVAALQRLGPLRHGTRILDIAAGTGALALPAAYAGAAVTAIDIAPGMVEVLTDRLAPCPDCEARIMDGQALLFDDHSFDAAVSVVGVSLFPDWRQGLKEQVRVVRPGGKAVLATWRTLPGGGPFVIMAQALRRAFPDRAPPPAPDGLVTLSDPDRMMDAMAGTGLVDVTVDEIEAVWEGVGGSAYLAEMDALHRYMPPYAALDAAARVRIDAEILALVDEYAVAGRVSLRTTVLLATGTRTG